MRVRIALGLAWCLLVRSAIARADDEAAAAKFFNDGSAAFERKEFPAAALLFEESYRLASRAATLYNASASWERAGNLPRAADDLYDALQSGGLTGDAVAAARQHLVEITQTLGSLDIEAPKDAKVSVDDLVRRPGSRRAYVQPGLHRVEAVLLDGQRVRREINVGRGMVVRLALEAPSSSLPPLAARETSPPGPRSAGGEGEAARGRGIPTASWVFFGASAVAWGGVAAFGVVTQSAYDAVHANHDDQAQRSRFSTYQAITNASVVVGAATAAAGLVFLWRPWASSPGATATALRLHVGRAGVDLAAHF